MREQTSERVARAIEQAIAAGEIPGCNLLVLRDGEELYYHEAGWADAAGRKPVRRDSIFRLYSMSKPVTAVAAMILLERGIISLCEPVSHYLPAFRDQVCVVEGQDVYKRQVSACIGPAPWTPSPGMWREKSTPSG